MTQEINEDLYEIFTECLRPAGEGVYTVHTAKERREKLQRELYGAPPSQVENLWQTSLRKNLLTPSKVLIYGVCSDSGGGILRGANWGPLFLRTFLRENIASANKLLKEKTFDLGDVRVNPHFLHDKYLNHETIERARKALFGRGQTEYPVSPLSLAEFTLDKLRSSRRKRDLTTPLLGLGGDHSISYPLVKSYLKDAKERGKKPAVIHFDAHTDLLQERLGVDICFGSWTAQIIEDLPTKNSLHQIGIRSSGKPKEHWEKTFGIYQYWADEISESGVHPIIEMIKERLSKNQNDEIYITFDIDALSSEYASATGTPEDEGLAPDQAVTIIRALQREFPIGSADLVEVAPFIKNEQSRASEPYSTLMCGASLCALFIELMSSQSANQGR